MTESAKPRRAVRLRPRQIVGFSLEPEMAREVKAHAGKRGLSLKKLFEEMWRTYKETRRGNRA